MGDTKQVRRIAGRWRPSLITLACLALLVAAFLAVLPVGARIAAENYLESTGMQADIEDVDINLFTGTIAVTDATARTAAGDGFDIGRAEINIAYLPLLSRNVRLSRLAVEDSSVDVRRTADDHLRVGGFTVLPRNKSPDEGKNTAGASWHFGVAHVSLDGLTIHYLQPGAGDAPEIERRITFSAASARDVNTGALDDPAQVDAALSIGESNAQVHGHLTAFGEAIGGELAISTSHFALDIGTPAARLFGLKRLAGRLDSELTVTANYSADNGLALAIAGHAQWRQPRVEAAGNFIASGNDWTWDGKLAADLFQPEGEAERVTTDSTLSLASIDAGKGDTLDFRQHDVRWQGRTSVTLTGTPEAWAAGALSVARGDLSIPAADISIGERQLDWQGRVTYRSPGATGADERLTTDGKLSWDGRLGLASDMDVSLDHQPEGEPDGISTDGTLSLASIDFSKGDTLEWHQRGLSWEGQTSVMLANTLKIQAEGSLSAGEGDLALPAVRISEQQLGWQGTATYRGVGAVHSEGQLTAAAPRIVIDGSQLTVAAAALDFNGLFDLAAGRTNESLPLTLTGDLDTTGLRIIDDALGRYLVASDQATARDLTIDTLDDIRVVERLDVAGLQAFERAAGAPRHQNHAAVIGSASASASGLVLRDLAALRIEDLDLSDAAAIYARTDDGHDEIGVFFAAADEADGKDSFDVHVVQATVGNDSTMVFVDTSVEPTVSLEFSSVRMKLGGFSTGATAGPAQIVASSDIGKNGTISSRGSLQLFGASGPDASIQANADSVYLPPFSGYVMAALERMIESGTLDARLDLDVNDGELDGLLHVTLYNFALSPSDEENIPEALGVSLDEAIELVRQDNGRIEFSTRILGDVTAPWFSTANLFRQALYAGLKSAIFGYFSPLGWVEAAGDVLGDLFSGQEFEPVIFAAGEATLSGAGEAYLARFADLLAQRPEPRIKLCGFAVPDDADARALFGFGEIDADNRASLKELAAKRSAAVADYLTAAGLDPARLTSCEPKIDPVENARPRVTLSF